MAALQSISGLISGLQTDDIINKLSEFKKQPINLLTAQKAKLTEKLAAWQNINARLLAVKLKAADLQNASAFNVKQAVSSNKDALSVSVTDNATVGNYSVKVVQLAQACQLGSDSNYSSLTDTGLGTGTITVTNTKTGAATVINISTGEDSLSSIRDAINASGAGVTANIVTDGTDTPYRLVLTSKQTGLDGQISVASNLSGGIGLSFDAPSSVVTAAQNAKVSMGSTNPIVVESSTNATSTLISGVTLNLLSADPDKSILITVSADTNAVVKKVQDFITSYNDYSAFVKSNSSYDPETQVSGALLGDYTLLNAQADITSLITSNVKGLSASEQGLNLSTKALAALSGLGIRVGTQGDLTLDESMLRDQLAADPTAVGRVLGRSGKATDSGITFLSAGPKTKESSGAGYAINITQAAAQSRLTAGVAVDNLAQDETLTINNGNVALSSAMSLADIVGAINEQSLSLGVRAYATQADGTGTGGYLTLKSIGFGSGAHISVKSSVSIASGHTSGFGSATATESDPAGESGLGTGDVGKDVQGTINGELAVGSGKTLTADISNATTGGLSIYVDSSVTGDKGFISYSRGVMAGINDILANLTDVTSGAVTTAQNGVQSQIDDIDSQITSLSARVDLEIDRIRSDFAILEGTLSKIQSQGQFLTAQFANLTK